MPLFWPEKCRTKWAIPGKGRVPSIENSFNNFEGHDGESYLDETFSVFPARVVELLQAQGVRYRQDFEDALSLIPAAKDVYQQSHKLAEESFIYAWCIVNTRCLYYDPPSTSNQSTQQLHTSSFDDEELSLPLNHPHNSDQFVVLCPLIDLFNHTSDSASACKVSHDSSGFTVTSRKGYSSGEDEEIFVSYGAHSNDFLLVEYGFVLPNNENMHDSINLDSVILPVSSLEQRRKLRAKQYLHEYTLFSPAANGEVTGVCWRTEVVARIGILSGEQWERFVDGVLYEDDLESNVTEKATATIEAWVKDMMEHAQKSVRALEGMRQSQQDIFRLFGDDVDNGEPTTQMTALSTETQDSDQRITEREMHLARRRFDLVFERWKQILHICQSFLHHHKT